MHRPGPGIISAESEDQAGVGMGLEFRTPASSPGRDTPVLLGVRLGRLRQGPKHLTVLLYSAGLETLQSLLPAELLGLLQDFLPLLTSDLIARI